ncbi:hypothetical protein [Qipengyuania flava]|uniref:hypothetical protein n=1 Tax=Qipengyuania flava TaxID=192812 RepID=UPI00321A328D
MTGALKALSANSYDQWVATDKWQFKQVMKSVLDKLNGRALYVLAEGVEEQRAKAQDLRHSIVHSVWGEQGGQAFAYDFRRESEIELSDLDAALMELDELCRQSQLLVLEVGRLLKSGEISQPNQDTRGPSIFVDGKLVRL